MTDEQRLELMLESLAGTLDAPDEARVRRALQSGDPAWAGAAAQAKATLDAVAAALEPVTPPIEVKSVLMTRIARDQDAKLRQRLDGSADPHRFTRHVAQAFTALAALILLAVVMNHWTNKRIELVRAQERQDASIKLKERDTRLMILQTMIERDQSIFKVLHSPQLKWVDLGGGKSKAAGRILIEPDSGTWHLFAASLDTLSPDRTYQLWLITPDQKMIPAGTFNPDSSGNASLTTIASVNVSAVAQAAITEEPAGGSPQPTTLPPVLAGKL